MPNITPEWQRDSTGWFTTGSAIINENNQAGYSEYHVWSGVKYVYAVKYRNDVQQWTSYTVFAKATTGWNEIYTYNYPDGTSHTDNVPRSAGDYSSNFTIYDRFTNCFFTPAMPVFNYGDEDSINNYINNGDISGAINKDDFAEKLYAKWIVAYTNAKDTKYSIAVDCPQFADPASAFYGKGEIAKVYVTGTYTAMGLTENYDTRYNYGQTWNGQLSDIVNATGGTFAEYISRQLSSLLDLDNLTLAFYVEIPTEGEEILKSAVGYVVFDHNEVDNYGFADETHGDTITFKAGEVLSDDDSNTSNADIEIADGDDIEEGTVPSVTGASLLTTCYGATPSQIQGIGSFLWGANFMTNVLLLNNSPIENIVGCKLFPVEFSGTAKEIKIGNVASGTNAEELSASLFDYWSSAVTIGAYFSGNLKYLDYAPYSKLEIYLPFVGLRELPLDECMGHKVKVHWLIDVITGTLQTDVMITHDGAGEKYVTIQTHISTIGVDIPLTAQNRAQVESAYISNAIHGGIAVATGNPVGAIGAVAGIATTQYHSQSTGAPSSSTAIGATLKPFLLRTVPQAKQIGDSTNDTYRKILGAPCNKACTLGSLSGYTEIENPSLAVAGATLREIDEINRLLREGVFL